MFDHLSSLRREWRLAPLCGAAATFSGRSKDPSRPWVRRCNSERFRGEAYLPSLHSAPFAAQKDTSKAVHVECAIFFDEICVFFTPSIRRNKKKNARRSLSAGALCNYHSSSSSSNSVSRERASRCPLIFNNVSIMPLCVSFFCSFLFPFFNFQFSIFYSQLNFVSLHPIEMMNKPYSMCTKVRKWW